MLGAPKMQFSYRKVKDRRFADLFVLELWLYSCRLLEALGAVFPIFAALETGLKMNGFLVV